MKFFAVVFDLDGTLLDTVPALARSMNEILVKHGFPTHTSDEYKTYIGNGIQALVEQSVPPGTDLIRVKEMYQKKSMLYQQYWQEGTTIYPGIVELLTTLQQRNIPMAIVSSKEDVFTQQIVKYFFHQFSFIAVTGRTATIPKKPDPTGVLQIISMTQITKDRWCLVGDKDVDIQTAENAGITPLWVRWGYQKNPPAGATILETPKNLLQYVATQ